MVRDAWWRIPSCSVTAHPLHRSLMNCIYPSSTVMTDRKSCAAIEIMNPLKEERVRASFSSSRLRSRGLRISFPCLSVSRISDSFCTDRATEWRRMSGGTFFFKQKTAYEMYRDWSSDVCSSDLMIAANPKLSYTQAVKQSILETCKNLD